MYFPDFLKILLVDDDEGFTHLIKFILNELGIKHVQTSTNFDGGIQAFHTFKPDICLLDISLGHNSPTGIELAENIRKTAPNVPIIFLTSYYTEETYHSCRLIRPCGFMNKEISKFKIHQALDLALLFLEQNTLPASELLPDRKYNEPTPPLVSSKQFFFKIGDFYKSIPVDQISYFFADNKLTYARVGTRNYPTSVQLKTLEEEFAHNFARIHKKYLVNINMIESIQPRDNSIMINEQCLPVGYAYRKVFFDRIRLLR